MPMIVELKKLDGKPAVVKGLIPVENIGLADGDYIQFTQPIDVKAVVYLAKDAVVAQVDVKSRFHTFDYRSLQEIEKDWSSQFTLDITVEPGVEKVDIEEEVRQEIILNLPLRVLEDDSQEDTPTVVPFAEDEEISDEEGGPRTQRPFEDL